MENKDLKAVAKEAAYWVADVLMRDNKNFRDKEVDSNLVLAAYLIYQLKLSGKPQDLSLEEVLQELELSEEIKAKAKERFCNNFWRACMYRVHSFEAEVFREIIDNYSEYVRTNSRDNTPDSVVHLGTKLLQLKSGDRVADICSGAGNFLLRAAELGAAECQGFEIDATAIERCQLRAAVQQKEVKVQQVDVVDLLCKYGKGKTVDLSFNKIFAEVPLGLKVREAVNNLTAADLGEFSWLLKRGSSFCWLVAYLSMQMLAPRGRVVLITDNGACFNRVDKVVREYFLDRGWLEAVISLPNRLLTGTSVGVTAIVLSRGNEEVRMVNAEELFQKGRRQNELSEVNVFEILRRCAINDEHSMLVTREVLKANEIALSPNRYLFPMEEFENGVKLEQLVVRFKRSTPLTASQMDSLNSEEHTGLRCIRLVDIQDGVVQENPPFMKPLNRKYDQYLLKDDDLIISKFGLPSRMAIVKVKPGEEWVMTGNMYALEFDQTKVNPYYVKAFLESEVGAKALASVTTDASVPVLSLDLLKTLQLPVPSMEEQERVAARYLVAAEKVRELQQKLREAMEQLGKVFEEK